MRKWFKSVRGGSKEEDSVKEEPKIKEATVDTALLELIEQRKRTSQQTSSSSQQPEFAKTEDPLHEMASRVQAQHSTSRAIPASTSPRAMASKVQGASTSSESPWRMRAAKSPGGWRQSDGSREPGETVSLEASGDRASSKKSVNFAREDLAWTCGICWQKDNRSDSCSVCKRQRGATLNRAYMTVNELTEDVIDGIKRQRDHAYERDAAKTDSAWHSPAPSRVERVQQARTQVQWQAHGGPQGPWPGSSSKSATFSGVSNSTGSLPSASAQGFRPGPAPPLPSFGCMPSDISSAGPPVPPVHSMQRSSSMPSVVHEAAPQRSSRPSVVHEAAPKVQFTNSAPIGPPSLPWGATGGARQRCEAATMSATRNSTGAPGPVDRSSLRADHGTPTASSPSRLGQVLNSRSPSPSGTLPMFKPGRGGRAVSPPIFSSGQGAPQVGPPPLPRTAKGTLDGNVGASSSMLNTMASSSAHIPPGFKQKDSLRNTTGGESWSASPHAAAASTTWHPSSSSSEASRGVRSFPEGSAKGGSVGAAASSLSAARRPSPGERLMPLERPAPHAVHSKSLSGGSGSEAFGLARPEPPVPGRRTNAGPESSFFSQLSAPLPPEADRAHPARMQEAPPAHFAAQPAADDPEPTLARQPALPSAAKLMASQSVQPTLVRQPAVQTSAKGQATRHAHNQRPAAREPPSSELAAALSKQPGSGSRLPQPACSQARSSAKPGANAIAQGLSDPDPMAMLMAQMQNLDRVKGKMQSSFA